MRTMPLRLLTWGTITAAVSSAAWLSAADQGSIFCSVSYRATSQALGVELPPPISPIGALSRSRAGASTLPVSGAARPSTSAAMQM